MGPYDWHFDRNGDGKLDFNERMQRMDFFDYINKQGIYTDDEDDEEEQDIDDDLDLDDDDDLDLDDDDDLGLDDF